MPFAIVIFAILLILVWLYNHLVTCRNQYKNAYAQIDVQLRRRHDLIPSLLEAAKAYMAHERSTLEAVIAARGAAQSASELAARAPGSAAAMQSVALAEGALTKSLGQLSVALEAYPELRASENIQQLSEELSSTENRIGFARQAFNDAVTDYNTAIERFPNNFLAGMFRFRSADLLQSISAESQRDAPKLQF